MLAGTRRCSGPRCGASSEAERATDRLPRRGRVVPSSRRGDRCDGGTRDEPSFLAAGEQLTALRKADYSSEAVLRQVLAQVPELVAGVGTASESAKLLLARPAREAGAGRGQRRTPRLDARSSRGCSAMLMGEDLAETGAGNLVTVVCEPASSCGGRRAPLGHAHRSRRGRSQRGRQPAPGWHSARRAGASSVSPERSWKCRWLGSAPTPTTPFDVSTAVETSFVDLARDTVNHLRRPERRRRPDYSRFRTLAMDGSRSQRTADEARGVSPLIGRRDGRCSSKPPTGPVRQCASAPAVAAPPHSR